MLNYDLRVCFIVIRPKLYFSRMRPGWNLIEDPGINVYGLPTPFVKIKEINPILKSKQIPRVFKLLILSDK